MNKEPLSVSELTNAIKSNLESAFPSVWVAGEVTNVTRAGSGHCYFTLKDRFATVPSVMWRSSAIRLKFDIKEGMEVIVRGRINVFAPHGKYQLDVEKLEPKGIGARELALRQLKEKLFTKGYFDPQRKRKLLVYPKRLALVTSATGAAVRDMLQVLTGRWPCEVFVCSVRVQGDGAAEEIAAAIRLLNRFHQHPSFPIDAMIVGRGGGSTDDLWEFNEEIVADAIFHSRILVISAVGHEIDLTIADLVADHRALTPTHAANLATPDRTEMIQALREQRRRMENAIRSRIQLSRQKLDMLATRRGFRLPLDRIRERESRLDELAARLHRTMKQKLASSGEAVGSAAGKLETLSPLNVLRRGYSLTRTESSAELVRDASRVKPGDRLLTKVADGEIVSRVEEVRTP